MIFLQITPIEEEAFMHVLMALLLSHSPPILKSFHIKSDNQTWFGNREWLEPKVLLLSNDPFSMLNAFS
jgi:hypothetical protein